MSEIGYLPLPYHWTSFLNRTLFTSNDTSNLNFHSIVRVDVEMVTVRGSKDSNDLHEKRDIELRILSASRAGDFALNRILGNGDNGVVVSAK